MRLNEDSIHDNFSISWTEIIGQISNINITSTCGRSRITWDSPFRIKPECQKFLSYSFQYICITDRICPNNKTCQEIFIPACQIDFGFLANSPEITYVITAKYRNQVITTKNLTFFPAKICKIVKNSNCIAVSLITITKIFFQWPNCASCTSIISRCFKLIHYQYNVSI